MALVRDDPGARVAARRTFYERHGFGRAGSAGFGRAEIDFMEWQRARGLLAPLDHPTQPGSPYWRVTNEGVARDAETAAEGFLLRLPESLAPASVRPWLDYLARPDGARWYRAHNTSVVAAMVRHIDAALEETVEERRFINEALYRLIHAEAMTLGYMLGRAGPLFADPRGKAVAALVRLDVLYPQRYPVRTALHASVRRRLASTLQRAGRSMVNDEPGLRALVERYLRPLAGPEIDAQALFSRFVGAVPIYPHVRAPMRDGEAG
ncbi:MAG: hypothetical protein R3B70_37970 [Polyangiaceae bacterium]